MNKFWFYDQGGADMATPPGCENQGYPCECNITNPTGQETIIVMGNSFAQRLFPVIYETFKTHFYSLQMLIKWAYEPLDLTAYKPLDQYDNPECFLIGDRREHLDLVINTKSDYVFIVNRWVYNFTQPIQGDLADETLIKDALVTLDQISKLTKHIVITGVLNHWDESWIPKILTRIQNNQSFEDIEQYSYEVFLSQHSQTLKRIHYLVSQCSKCSFFDWHGCFCDDEKNLCRAFDPKTLLSYYRDDHHTTAYGAEAILPCFKKFIEQIKAN
ncbi:hypothetical protein L596_030066 [Steinernema carpocapsae]|nr:hypothetical protein L596_030066 [Steinernema carpocapsae]